MTAKYFAILTNQGAARLANATAIGTSLNLTQIAIGDGNGVLPTPDATQTRLVNQKRIAPLNALLIDPTNTSQIIAEQIIPENEGGYWIRELGLYDDEGVLIAVANCPETYKPLMQEGSGRTQTIRMVITVSSTAAVTLKIDPAVVLATRKYVDDKTIEVRTYADNLMSQHVAAGNPHAQYVKVADMATYVPPGIPVPYPSATPPIGWLLCNGATFNKTLYPALAAVFTSGNLPDLRGEFIRGWDNGRGVDTGRVLLSSQGDAIRPMTGSVDDIYGGPAGAATAKGVFATSLYSATGPFYASGSSGQDRVVHALKFAIPSTIPTAGEARPRNIAFNYIVRAA
ncbi:Phage Tail Collar Domain [Kosakonia radicincitans]|uniref:phage tail-collar fiber domain-containing protein n=1 Tax=Kosakonia radicincitans TaxID=283686 RepID=UPI0009A79B62|nr:phage tail protein [Kosakonia radicincitans]SKC18521.1 Phage Tail Collar Domain [Kosakonia radicincitans]